MAPIRVGLLGLSSTPPAGLAPGLWAVQAHLPWLVNSPDYKIVALANSSVKAAEQAIKLHGLPEDTKAYGTPEDLANDADVDLVVVSVNVGKHYELIKPALLAKKDAFVEWPLGASTAEALELTELAKANGSKTIVGLQARADPLVIKAKEIVQSGRVGDLTSVSVVGTFGQFSADTWIAGAEYYLSKDSGGNMFTIFFGHFLDSFIQVNGGFVDVQSVLKTAFPTTTILNLDGQVVQENYPRTAPDHVLVQGTLESGAVASLHFRVSTNAVDETGFRWIITGTKGELEITAPQSGWQMGSPSSKLRLRIGDGAVEEVNFSELQDAQVAKIPIPGTNTAGIYNAFTNGQTDRYATFESSVELHKLLDRIAQASK